MIASISLFNFLSVTLIAVTLVELVSANYKTVQVGGTLKCPPGNTGRPDAKVIILNKKTLARDKEIAFTQTNLRGEFNLQGYDDSFLRKFRPRLLIKHRGCNPSASCLQTWEYDIPSQYIDSGGYHVGTIDLGGRDCHIAAPDAKCWNESQDCD